MEGGHRQGVPPRGQGQGGTPLPPLSRALPCIWMLALHLVLPGAAWAQIRLHPPGKAGGLQGLCCPSWGPGQGSNAQGFGADSSIPLLMLHAVPETPLHPPGLQWKDEAQAPYGPPAGAYLLPHPAAESSPFHEDTPLLPGPSSSGAFCSGYISFDHRSALGGCLPQPVPLPCACVLHACMPVSACMCLCMPLDLCLCVLACVCACACMCTCMSMRVCAEVYVRV